MFNSPDARLFIQVINMMLFGCNALKLLINSSKHFQSFTQLASYPQQESENLSTTLDFPFTSQGKTLITIIMVCPFSSCAL